MEETTTAITAVKEEVRLRDWTAHFEAQQTSGMTVQKWCEENGIDPKTYYYHLRKLREKCVASAPAIVQKKREMLLAGNAIPADETRIQALHEKPYLYTFLEDGNVSIGNNRAENAIRLERSFYHLIHDTTSLAIPARLVLYCKASII